MERKLSPRDGELYKRCDEVLHYMWDPIGVAAEPGAGDEYHSYLPQVFALVRDDTEPDQIAEYLVTLEEDRMGLPPNHERACAVVEVLIEWREWIWEHAA